MSVLQIILHIFIIATGVNIAMKHKRVNLFELSLWIVSAFVAGVFVSVRLLNMDGDSNRIIVQLSSVAIMYVILFFVFNIRFRIEDVMIRLKIIGAHFIYVIIVNLS